MFELKKPITCPSRAVSIMRRIAPTIEGDNLLAGAFTIGLIIRGEGTFQDSTRSVIDIRDEVKSRVKSRDPNALLAHLHDVFFEEMKFIGDVQCYHDPLNSSVARVLERRKGLPITLSLIYKVIAESLGLKVRGLGFPGHFCVGVEMPDGLMIVDPFYGGRVLNQDEARERIRDTYGSSEWSDDLLTPVSNRHWLTRIMQNLMHTFSDRDNLDGLIACLELELILWPEQKHLARDIGLVLARRGFKPQARDALLHYLNNNADDPQCDGIAAIVNTL